LCSVQVFKNWYYESESLSTACLRGSKDIYTFKSKRNSLRLDICELYKMGGFKAGFGEIGERKVGKVLVGGFGVLRRG
jgi:hypothetical protein